MRDKLLVGLGLSFVVGAASIAGCAESDSVTTTGSGSGSGAGGSGTGGEMHSGSGGTGTGGGEGGKGGMGQGGMGGSGGEGGMGQGGMGQGGMGGMGQGGMGGSGGGMVDPCMNGCPAGFFDIDGNPLTGMCGCEYSCNLVSPDSDPIDDNYEDANCDGTDGLAEKCIFVSTTEGNDASSGARLDPMQTIDAAIKKAVDVGVPSVCLSGETYTESVTVVSGVSIYGGFDHTDADFKFRRKATATTNVAAIGTVFHAPQIDADTHIESITMEAAPTGNGGESTYGVRFGGGMGQLFVRWNTITVGPGSGGMNGTDGATHPNAQAPNGNNGTAGAAENNNSGFGGAAPNCAVPGGKGGDGGVDAAKGQDGSNGTGGTPGGLGAPSNGCTPGLGDPGDPGGQGQNGQNAVQ
ncbi:MAG: PE-PGRS family protein, partial [Polyangiaceae bacterium]|nr:PE-PGRS family protein [Polyangiaceae bacterium]